MQAWPRCSPGRSASLLFLPVPLGPVQGIAEAYVYGSWAARYEGRAGPWPVGDIDVLILGDPDRDQLYTALSDVEKRRGRPVQATIRGTRLAGIRHWRLP